jgi:hypothetical protein
MRVLFDQATPVPIREFLIGHAVRTAAQEHWDTPLRSDTRLNRSLSTDRSCLVAKGRLTAGEGSVAPSALGRTYLGEPIFLELEPHPRMFSMTNRQDRDFRMV